MECRKEFEAAHIEQLGHLPADIKYSGGRYYPSAASDLPFPAEDVTKRYLLFKAGRRSMEPVMLEAIERLKMVPGGIERNFRAPAISEIWAVVGLLQYAIEKDTK